MAVYNNIPLHLLKNLKQAFTRFDSKQLEQSRDARMVYRQALLEYLRLLVNSNQLGDFTLRVSEDCYCFCLAYRQPSWEQRQLGYISLADNHDRCHDDDTTWIEPISYPGKFFDVFVYLSSYVMCLDVPGGSPDEAMKRAKQELSPDKVLPERKLVYPLGQTGFSDDWDGFMVDQHGDFAHEDSQFYDHNRQPVVVDAHSGCQVDPEVIRLRELLDDTVAALQDLQSPPTKLIAELQAMIRPPVEALINKKAPQHP